MEVDASAVRSRASFEQGRSTMETRRTSDGRYTSRCARGSIFTSEEKPQKWSLIGGILGVMTTGVRSSCAIRIGSCTGARCWNDAGFVRPLVWRMRFVSGVGAYGVRPLFAMRGGCGTRVSGLRHDMRCGTLCRRVCSKDIHGLVRRTNRVGVGRRESSQMATDALVRRTNRVGVGRRESSQMATDALVLARFPEWQAPFIDATVDQPVRTPFGWIRAEDSVQRHLSIRRGQLVLTGMFTRLGIRCNIDADCACTPRPNNPECLSATMIYGGETFCIVPND